MLLFPRLPSGRPSLPLHRLVTDSDDLQGTDWSSPEVPPGLAMAVSLSHSPIPNGFSLISSNLWPDDLFSSVVPPLSPSDTAACSCQALLSNGSLMCAPPTCERAKNFLLCSPSDHGGRPCCNQLRAPAIELYLSEVRHGHLGVFTGELLAPGSVIAEFCGRVLSAVDFRNRSKLEQGPCFYAELTAETVLDGLLFGSMASLANYSCTPNCDLNRFWIPDDSRQFLVPRLFLVVGSTAITAGSALTVRLNFVPIPLHHSTFQCFCNQTSACLHFIAPGGLPDDSEHEPAIAHLRHDVPGHGRLGELIEELPTSSAPRNLAALRPHAYLTMVDCVKLDNLGPNQASMALKDILEHHRKLHHRQVESKDTWGGNDKLVKQGHDPATRWEGSVSLFNVKFTARGQQRRLAIHNAAAKALAGLLSFAPAQSYLDLRLPPAPHPADRFPLVLSRSDLLQQLEVIWTHFLTNSMRVSKVMAERAARSDDPNVILESARVDKDKLANALLASFFKLVPSYVAACSALGFISACPLFVLKGPAAVALYKRKKSAELRNQWRTRALELCQFARFDVEGSHSHVVRIGEIQSHPNAAMLATHFAVSDFVDSDTWGTYPKTRQLEFTWQSLYKVCELPPPDMQGNVVSTARIDAVLYPPKSVWEFRQFKHWVAAQLGSVYQNNQWVPAEGGSVPLKALGSAPVVGAVNEDLPSAQVAAQQARFTESMLKALETRALVDGATMARQGGSFHFRMNPGDAEGLADFCKQWRALVDAHLDKSVYRRPINNGIEYFLMPSTSSSDPDVAAARAMVREGAVRFALGLPWDSVTEVPAEVAGLSVLATHKGTFLHQLEVYLHTVAAEYGILTGRNFLRMKTCAFSLLVFQPGACKQQWHWDELDTETLAINVLVSRCHCGQCQFKGTEVLQGANGDWLPPLPKSCTRYCSSIKYVLQRHLSLGVLLQLLPPDVRRAVEVSISPIAACPTPQALDESGILMYENGQVGSAAITCGPHRGPGHDGACERMVLFITMTRAIAVPYDSDDQVNAVDVIASQHGRHSQEFLWFVIDMELVRGIRAVATMRGATSVTKEMCSHYRFPAHGDWVDGMLSLQTLMDAIVSVAHLAAAFARSRVPARKGTEGSHGLESEGVPDDQARGAAFGIFTFLTCGPETEAAVLASLQDRLCQHPAKGRATAIRDALRPIKRVWLHDREAEEKRQEPRWESVRRKLQKIALQNQGDTSDPTVQRSGYKRKTPDMRLSGKQRIRRRSGPAAGKVGPLDSSAGESSSGVESPEDRAVVETVAGRPSRPAKR
jgi:hypothetical protein